jgi:uncharacterized membrane protein HdeD (DUF308 family)
MNETTEVKRFLHSLWWMFLLRGLVLLLLGIIAIAWPGITILALSIVFAIHVILIGVINIIMGIHGLRRQKLAFLTLILGILEVGAGVYTLQAPGFTVAVFILVIGFTFIIQGILGIISAFDASYEGDHRYIAVIFGAVSIIAGFLVARYPAAGGIAFIWMIGAYGLIVGALQTALALGLKSEFEKAETELASA